MAVAEPRNEEAEKSSSIFRSILVPVSFSEASERGLKVASLLATRYQGRLSVVHVLQNTRENKLDEADAQQQLRRSTEKLHVNGTIDAILTKHGPVLDGVLSSIRDCSADLLVVGTGGRGGLSKVAFGSESEELLRLAECPVLTIGPKADVNRGSALHTILFATDFGAGSTRLLPRVMSLSRRERARLILMHMTQPMPATSASLSPYSPSIVEADELQEWEGSSRKRALRHLQEWVASQMHAGDTEPEYVVGTEFLPEAVLGAAGRLQTDVIAMGANRSASPRWSAHFPWSAVHEIIHGAPCPVMTVAA